MEKFVLDLTVYTETILKMDELQKSMKYAKEGISEKPLKELCEKPDYCALAVEMYGPNEVETLVSIAEGSGRHESLRKWSKHMDDMQDNILVLDTCKGDIRPLPAVHLVYAYRGSIRITTENGNHILQEGQLGIFDINFPHGVSSVDDEVGIPISCLLFKPYLTEMIGTKGHASPLYNEFLSKAFYPGNVRRTNLFIDTSNDDYIRYLFAKALWEYTYNRPFALDSVDAALMEVLIHLMREYGMYIMDESPEYRPLSERTKQILDYIDANLCDVTLDAAAKAFHFSTTHLSRMIKEQTGSTFLELVHKARLREATYYLRVQDMTVAEVANLVGYNNVTYFYKIFQKKYQVSPNEYRKSFGSFSESYRMELLRKDK